jgi:hypothetical protein
MSKIGQICDLIKDAHIMETNGLHDYHVAREVMNAARVRDIAKRFSIVRRVLHPYRVTVSNQDGQIRIYRPDTQSEVLL